jgi:hypothetical protein
MDERLDAVRELWRTYREQGRIRTPEAMRGDYLFFVHSFRDGRVSRIAAHVTKDAALADIASRYRGQAWPS